MRCWWVIAVGIGAVSGRSFAASRDSLQLDTLRFVFPPVQVQAPSVPEEQGGFVSVWRIEARELARSLFWQGADVLWGMPGVFVRDYGGVAGMKTVSVRGLGAAQTLILWEGVRLNTAVHGVYDVGNLPLAFVESVELALGGGSAMLGAYAGSGVLFLRSLPREAFPFLRTTVGLGSFGQRRAAVIGHVSGQAVAVRLGLNYLSARDDYPFLARQFGELRKERRQNADRVMLSAMCALGYEGSQVQVWGQLLGYRSHRGVPGPVVQGRVEFAHARLEEEEWLGLLRFLVPVHGLEWSMAARRLWLFYRDPDARAWGERGAHDDATTWEASSTIRWSGKWGRWLRGGVWGEMRWEQVVGTLLRPQGREAAQRGSAALSVWGHTEVGWGELWVGLRGETNQHYAPALSPTLGIRGSFAGVQLQLQWSWNFRPPSFAELYYFNFGSPDLRPERTSSWNLGLEWGLQGKVLLRGNLFSLWVRDQIVAVPRSPVMWSARNIGRVWSRGMEIGGEYAPMSWIRLFAQVTYQRVTDQTGNPYTTGRQLPYVPQLLASGSLLARFAQVEGEFRFTAMGERWSLPDQSSESRLSPYVLADCALSYHVLTGRKVRGEVRIALRNAFDVAYELIRNYPLPGRSFRAEVMLQWQPQGDVSSHARH